MARLAGKKHGLVTRAALLGAGLSDDQIRWRLRTGELIREFPGVYRVGHRAPTREATYMAAVLACGQDALLAGRAAAHLFGILKGRAPAPEVIAPKARRVPGVTVRRTRERLPRNERTLWLGIPTTSPARTLVDLAATDEDLSTAFHEATIRHHTTPDHIEAVLQRRPNTPHIASIRACLSGDSPILLSDMEREFRRLTRAAGLPLPRTNRPAGGKYVDCRWPQHKLTVELDSYRFHRSRHAWESDHQRRREARARGDEFRRYTYTDVFEQPRPMLAELKELLGG